MSIEKALDLLPSEEYYLPILSVAAVLRKIEILERLLIWGKRKNIEEVKIYESLLQTYLFAGFPSALISLQTFHKVYPDYRSKVIPPENIENAGELSCRKIYGDKMEKLIENVERFSPEISEWLIQEGYGKVLSREGLTLNERELNIIAVLSALGYENQLYSHIYGAFRTGAAVEQISIVINSLSLIDQEAKDFGNKVLNRWVNR